MAMLSFCGIDVSKDRLDVMVLPEQQSFAVRNDAAGWAELIARLRDKQALAPLRPYGPLGADSHRTPFRVA